MGKMIFLPDLNVTPPMDMDDESSVAVDRLSKLPEPLIHVIISFLPMREVVRTAPLSKRWQHLWSTLPYLHFQFDEIEEDSYNFPDFVKKVLERWRGEKILKFGIDLFAVDYDHNAVDSWLLFAVEKQVEELFVKLIYEEYLLPDAVYSCSSIKKLSLNCLELAVKEIVRWNQLNSLTIDGSYVNEDVLNRILLSAPLLEVLDLRTHLFFGDLNILSTSLKMLKIAYDDIGAYDEVKAPTIARISAPFLQSLEFAGIRYTSCLLKVLSLTNANLDFDMILRVKLSWRIEVGEMLGEAVHGISHAVKLTSNKWSLMLLVDESKDDTVVLFSNAKFLKLCAVDAREMLNVLEMFPKLEMLIVEHMENGEYNPMVSDTTFPRPSLLHLKRVEITWCVHDVSIFPVIKTLWETSTELIWIYPIWIFSSDVHALIFHWEPITRLIVFLFLCINAVDAYH